MAAMNKEEIYLFIYLFIILFIYLFSHSQNLIQHG